MANALIKNTTFEVATVQIVVLAVPYRPAIPGRTVYETRTVCGFRYSGPGHYVYSTDAQTGRTTAIWVPDNPSGSIVSLVGTWSCYPETVPVTYPGTPAQPYVPPQIIYADQGQTGYNLGWNAGARSLRFITGDGNTKFKVRANVVGAIVGLNYYDGIDARYNGNTTNYAFQCQRGLARVVENGVVKTGAFAYTDATEFEIAHASGTITYKMAGSTVYTSLTAASTTVAAWLEASLYSGTDTVFDPSLTQTGSGDTATKNATMAASLPSLTMFAASGPFAELRASMRPMTAAMAAGLSAPAFAVANLQLPSLSFNGTGLTGEKGTLGGSMLPLDMLAADHPYGELFASMAPMTANFSAYEGHTNASMAAVGFLDTTMASANFLVVTMNSAGTLTSTMLTSALVPAQMLSAATMGSTMALNGVFTALMESLMISRSELGDTRGSEDETWVVNLDSSGSTTYSNYSFNSYAFFNGKYYGANSTGIFELEGDTDSGAPIRARVSFGKQSAGNALKKTWQQCYLGMSAQGNLFLKVIAEGAEYIYRTRDWNSEMQQQRVTFGKGLRTNYVTLELYNEDGADFELDTVEFIVADLSRKI